MMPGQRVTVVHASPWGSTEHTREVVSAVDGPRVLFESGAVADRARGVYEPASGAPLELDRIES
jgi:hypothetical protein